MKNKSLILSLFAGLITTQHAFGADVCFYEHVNYTGASYCAGEGTSNVPSGWNDRMSSVRVPTGMQVELFEHANSGGRKLLLTQDAPNLVTSNFNDIATATAITDFNNKVCVYEHVDFAGTFTCFGEGQTNLNATWNNKISSVKIPEGLRVDLFTEANLAGNKLALSATDSNLVNDGFNDAATSMLISKVSQNTVCFFEHLNFTGNSFCSGPGAFNAPSGWDKMLTSFTIESGYKVDLYSLQGFTGNQLTFDTDVPNLVAHQFNDQMSSFKISKAGDECVSGNCQIQADVTGVTITNAQNQAPKKGDALKLTFTVKNTSNTSGFVRLTPHLTSKRFADYNDVTLSTVDVTLGAQEQKQISVNVNNFILDLKTQKRFAIGRGDYEINRVEVTNSVGTTVNDTNFSGKAFNVAASNAVLTAVVYDQAYFNRLNYTQGAETYLKSVFTRPGELFTPGNNSHQSFPGGFDQMMNVRHMFNATPGFVANDGSGLGFCEQGVEGITKSLGLARNWGGGAVRTDINHHGFDYAIALTPTLVGGVACGWINIQITGLFSFDLSMNRSQILVVHETGHLFGAPHCDPIQNYVMCSGEKHDRYKQAGIFVWHQVSREKMSNRFD